MFLAVTPLYKILFPDIHPEVWACPIQQGVPFFVDLVMSWLTLIAAIVFLYGIVASAIGYMTAFGNEDAAKKARQTLQWTVIGAIVVMMSAFAIGIITSALLPSGTATDFRGLEPTANCISSDVAEEAKEESFWQEFNRRMQQRLKQQ